jgi:hypothetical protein
LRTTSDLTIFYIVFTSLCSWHTRNSTVNVAIEIMEGKRTVEEARGLYGDTAAAFVIGRDAPYAEKLLFNPPTEDTGDPDEFIVSGDRNPAVSIKEPETLHVQREKQPASSGA